LKHAVTDLTGVILVLVYQPQKTVRWDHYWVTLSCHRITFFADYASSSCLKDCEPGPFGCMLVPPPVTLYDSIAACCSVGVSWVDFRYCTSRSVGNYTNGWIVDIQNEKCTKDCDPTWGPPCHEVDKEDIPTHIYDTVDTCCGKLDWIDTSVCVSVSEESPTRIKHVNEQVLEVAHQQNPDTGMYYPDWAFHSGTCLEDGNEPFHMKTNPNVWLFKSLEECCDRYYSGWNKNTCIDSNPKASTHVT